MSKESAFTLDGMKFNNVTIGDREIEGIHIFSIAPPSRGKPYWLIRYADDLDEREQIVIAAGIPVVVNAETAPAEAEEEEVVIDE